MDTKQSKWFKGLGVISGLGCIGAGIFLLSLYPIGDASSFTGNKSATWWTFALSNAIGIYFISKGIFLGAILWAKGMEYEIEDEEVLEENTEKGEAKDA